MSDLPELLLRSRRSVAPPPARAPGAPNATLRQQEGEGGGVIGAIATVPIQGRHLIGPCERMRNRGNGKGAGVAMAGCFPDYADHYALQIAFLEGDTRREVEKVHILPHLEVAEAVEQPCLDDHREVPGLRAAPPRLVRYFVRARASALDEFAGRHTIPDPGAAEEELLFQAAYRLNAELHAGDGRRRAFVLSCGRNMAVFKAVGYAEDVIRYYRLEGMPAYLWIGHQRYSTGGLPSDPSGAHPFCVLNGAVAHNGCFANHQGVVEYLGQRGYGPLFGTDTELAAHLFDLYGRVYGYPQEYIVEALAPTTGRDLAKLPPEKQEIYRALQRVHLHGAPDGPWSFTVARGDARSGRLQLIGLGDPALLRPQIFALSQGEVSVGAIASEKQAVDALLASLARDDPRICPVADRYWSARGGSADDGGAFVFSLSAPEGERTLECEDRFGRLTTGVSLVGQRAYLPPPGATVDGRVAGEKPAALPDGIRELPPMETWSLADLDAFLAGLVAQAGTEGEAWRRAVALLTLLNDRRYPTGSVKRARVLARVRAALEAVFRLAAPIGSAGPAAERLIGWERRGGLAAPPAAGPEVATLLVDCAGFEPQGEASAAALLARAHRLGWKRLVLFGCRGDRFIGAGLGTASHGVRVDVYGSSGDYLGAGLDGAEIHVHGDAQDQVGQILRSGRLVVHGDVGHALLYAARGGEAYVLGNAASRPLINAMARVRAVINGTALIGAGQSFMGGPATGGGFLVLNGMAFDETGRPTPLPEAYPGPTFFSRASGGAAYLRDPGGTLSEGQLTGVEVVPFAEADWAALEPHLRENEGLFGIRIWDLLDGREARDVYRKVVRAGDR